MHPPSSCSLMTYLASAVSLGLLVTAAPVNLGFTALQSSPEVMLRVAARSEDDRGSGRLSRMPAVVDSLSFRGSGRITPNPPVPVVGSLSPVAYRSSGRIADPCTA
jgi:hypothetical protein